jgi:nicotinamidase-related amidase
MQNRDNVSLAESAAVLFVDHQVGTAERGQTADPKAVDKNAARLAKAAHIFGMPIVVSVVGLRGKPQLTEELRAALGDDVALHERQGTDSLDDAAIAGLLKETGRSTLLIAGIVTEIAVQRPALSGARHGYWVQVVLDASNGRSERSEQAALMRMSAAGVELTSIPAILGELARDFGDPRTTELFALMA